MPIDEPYERGVTMLEDQIRLLDDAVAVRILEAVAGAKRNADEGAYLTDLTPDLKQALRDEFALGPSDPVPTGEGDVAREALIVLAEDPQDRPALEAFVQNPSAIPRRMVLMETAGATALVVAALIALQTRVTIRRDKQGTLTWPIDKKPTEPALLKPLVAKLVSLMG
jgi:hypothetical protein